MQVQLDIEFDDLLKIVKSLSATELSKLRKEIENAPEKEHDRENFRKLLLKGPTFSKKQLNTIAKTRKAINEWRRK